MKAKIFYGPARSGKSRTAEMLRQLFGTDKTIYLSGKCTKEEKIVDAISKEVTTDTQLIVIDDMKSNFQYEYFYSMLPHGIFIQNRKREALKELSLPNVLMIFITNHRPKQADPSFLGRFDLIEFPSSSFNFETILSQEQKDQILKEYFDNVQGEDLIKLAIFFLATLGEHLIKSNAGEITLKTDIHPVGVDARRKVKMIVTQTNEKEN